jgi:hypothetical protein
MMTGRKAGCAQPRTKRKKQQSSDSSISPPTASKAVDHKRESSGSLDEEGESDIAIIRRPTAGVVDKNSSVPAANDMM